MVEVTNIIFGYISDGDDRGSSCVLTLYVFVFILPFVT